VDAIFAGRDKIFANEFADVITEALGKCFQMIDRASSSSSLPSLSLGSQSKWVCFRKPALWLGGQRLYGFRFLEPYVAIELLRQMRIEIMARELGFGSIDNANCSL
jgi:hypothetical protein